MKRIFRSVCALALTTLLCSCGSDAPDSVQPQLQAMVESKLAAYKTANNLSNDAGVLVHLVSPRGTWTVSAGSAAGAGAGSHYRIASVTKTFTSAAIMLLDQQGKLDITKKVTDLIPGTDIPYLPDTPGYQIPHKSEITIEHLLSHRSGVFDVCNDPVPEGKSVPYAGKNYLQYIIYDLNDPRHQFTFDELVGVNSLNELSYWAPDGGYHYSNTGYSLLAKIIERVSGKSYDRFITDNFFIPMGLTHSSAPWNSNDRTLPAPYVKGYIRPDATTQLVESSEDNMSANVAEGNIISTPADAARWMRMLLTGMGPVNKGQITRMTTKPAGNTSYALGLDVGDLGIGHTGAHLGYMNYVVYHPADDVTVVVVVPFIDYDSMNEQADLIMDLAKEARKTAGYTAVWPTQ